ncbi:MAG: efflux RND transporter permease subunit [Acidobacteriota bacterium]|nr:efflux RND transporter permease subunit [Acidobacteriota bacterium]
MIQSIVSRGRLVVTAAVLLSLTGLGAWFQMPRQEDPTMPDYWGNIVVSLPGADAETVERLLLEPVEEHLAEVEEIGYTTARALNELCIVEVELLPTTDDIDKAWDDVEEALEDARADFPAGAGAPVLDRHLNEQESIVVSITGSGDPLVMLDAARSLKRQLLGLNEVAKVKLIGDPGEQITIEYDDAQAARLGLDPRTLAAQLSARNNIIPGGSIKMAGQQVNLRPRADFATVDEIAQTPVILPSGAALPLSEMARVRKGPSEPAGEIMRVNGERAVGLGVVARDGVHIVDFGEAVQNRLDQLAPDYAPLKLESLIFQPDRVQARLDNLGLSLLLGILVVAGVLLIFMGARLGMVVAGIIPLVAFTSLALFASGGGVLQQMSISALVIALGMLVDNAIVMAENIQWRIDRGESRTEAAMAAVRELAVPLASATGTTLAAFLPMLMAESFTADFTRDLPIVIMLTLTVSYLFAVFVTPTLSKMVLRRRTDGGGEKPHRVGEGLAALALRRSGVIVVAAVVIVGISFFSAGFVKQQFFPSSDRNQIVVEVKLPEGSHLDRTDRIAFQLEQELLNDKRVVSVAGYIGRSGPHFYYNISQIPWSPHFAQLVVTTTNVSVVDDINDHIRHYTALNLPGVEVIPRRLEQGPPVDNPVEVRLLGDDLEELNNAADMVLRELQSIPGAVNVRHDMSLGSPSLRFKIDDAAAARMGLTRADVAVSLFGKTRGLPVGRFRSGEDPIPVVLRSARGELLDADTLETIEVSSATGATAPLSQVAESQLEWRPAAISHRNRSRIATVSAQLAPGYAFSDIQSVLEPRLAALDLPRGIRMEYGGQGEGSRNANASMAVALPFGLILLIGILLAEFNSFRRVGIVMVTVPLSAAGVVPGLLISGEPFGFMSMLGVIALIGIVVNNAIVLLDVIETRRREGASLNEAVHDAVVRRTRPILLTTTTTVMGLLPLAFSGSSLWPPLAWAIISGLIASTMLTLLVVPSLYLVFFRPRRRPKWFPGRSAAAVTAVLLAAFLPGLNLRADEPERLTLEQVMERAVNRPAARAAAESAEAAERDAEAVRRAGVLPVVGGQAVETYRDEAISLETPAGSFQLGDRDSLTVDLQVIQPLYDPVNRRGDLPAARAAASAENKRSARTRQELRFLAANAYLSVLGVDAELRATESFIRSLTDRLAETESRVRLGRTIEAEALKLKLDLESAERDRRALQEQRKVETWQLGRVIGSPGPVVPASDPTETLPQKPELNTDLIGKLGSRFDVEALMQDVAAAEGVRQSVRAERLPKLEAIAAYSYADGDPFRDGNQWQANLQVSWTPFASGTRRPRIAAASHRVRALEAQLEERRKDAELEIRQAHANLSTAQHTLEVAERSVTLAAETLRVEVERHREGRATTNDLLEAEADLRRAQTGRELARIDIVRQDLLLQLATGKL